MQASRLKSLSLALVFCLLPNFGLRAQVTPTTISTAETAARALAASEELIVEGTGSIIVSTGIALTGAGSNTISNSGEIRSDDSTALQLQSLNRIVNSGSITGGTNGISLEGAAAADTITANPTTPAYDASETLRDAYYFNNKVINETGGTITGAGTGHAINIAGARAQILNTGGTISAAGSGHGIFFNTGSGQGFVQNTGNITAADGIAIAAASGVNEITIHNDGGTIESTSGIAIVLQSLNLIVNSGNITGSFNGISLAGAALQATIDASPTAPAYDSTQTLRDAYYFNNKVINEVAGTITGTITAAGIGHGIAIDGARAQILNTGDIIATGTGSGIYFDVTSDQGFVYNAGNIRATGEFAIRAATNDSGTANEIVIHNTGTIENTVDSAIRLQSLNLIVNSGTITAARDGIQLLGTADATMLTNNAEVPAYDSTQTLRDAYYFNNKVVNETGAPTAFIPIPIPATITGAGTGHGINIAGLRAQILNTGGDITATGAGHGIHFNTGSGQGFVHNTGNITAASGNAISAASGVNAIIIHNTGIIESTASTAIVLQSLNLIVNSGDITGGTDSEGISLAGAADATMLTNNADVPAYDTTDAAVRDAYYFNNKVINEAGGTITGKGTSSAIAIAGARAQILNTGDIVAEGTGHGIGFGTGSGQSFVQNTGNITAASGNAISTGSDIDAIVIHNTGTIESISGDAIQLENLNLIVNSASIIGAFSGISLEGTALAARIIANPTAPAYNATDDLRDAYYFNNKIINQAGGTITGKSAGHGISIYSARRPIFSIGGARAQILNTGGDIVAEGSGHGIAFGAESGQGFVYNTGSITAVVGNAIFAARAVNEIVIHNTGTIESTFSTAIVLQNLNLIVNSGDIIGAFDGISLEGTASPVVVANNPTAPAYNATDDLRDAYYFNNKVINQAGGAITGKSTGHGIRITSARTQILNTGGDIVAGGTGNAINFGPTSSQSFLRNTGSITAASGFAIETASSVNEITIHNTGTIENTTGTSIHLAGVALAATLRSSPTAPAYNATQALRDAYYFNSKVINETGGTITGRGALGSIRFSGTRGQVLNIGGDIIAEDIADGIYFDIGSGQSFVQNTSSINALLRATIGTAIGADAIIIHNTGILESAASHAIVLESLNLIVNSGSITGAGGGIQLAGVALAATLRSSPTAPAYNATQALRDAYYFNNKVVNETGGTITSKNDGRGISILGLRAQVLNTGGDIVTEGRGHGISFGSGSGQSFVYNTSNISAASGSAIHAFISINEIVIHNTGTLESITDIGVSLQSLNLIVNSGSITGPVAGIHLAGAALAATRRINPTAPAYDATDTLRDAYYFNNEVVNEASGTITGAGTGHAIAIAGARAQILNIGGITAEGTGHGIAFSAGAGQGFVHNTGSITAASGFAIVAGIGIDAIAIHNTGTMESTAYIAIALQSLNLIVNSGDITGGLIGIQLLGTALPATRRINPTAPAYNATQALRDAYYFNNKVVNETGGTITSEGAGSGISILGARAQILNTGGDIVAEGTGSGIFFNIGAGESFVYNTSNISTASGNTIAAASGVNEIVIHNTGTMESTAGQAIALQSLNLIVNSGDITGAFDGIRLAGAPSSITLVANAIAPVWYAEETLRDAYYFNNKVVNETGGTITGKSTGHGIHVVDKRVQIFNHGDIVAEGTGHGIYFDADSGESIVVNTSNISSEDGWGIYAHDDTAGSIIVINSGCITGGAGAIRLSGADDILVIRSGSKVIGTVDFDDGTQDELIYASVPANRRLASPTNLEITSELAFDPSSEPDDGSGDASALGNHETLFRLSDDFALDLNASVQDAIYEHNFGLHSEKDASENASKDAPWWTQAFGSFRKQDASDANAKADHSLGGVLLGYDFNRDQVGNLGLPLEDLGVFFGVALGSLSTDDDAELTSQSLFGGANFKFTKDKFFYGVNLTIGFTSHKSERSAEESGETVKIEGKYTGFFLLPEFIVGMKSQAGNVNLIPSFRLRYLLASLGEYDEDGDAASRVSVEKRNTGTMESRAQLAFPLQLANQAWKLEPRLGLEYRIDLNKDAFDVETVETETPIDYDAEKESNLGIFGGLSVRYLAGNTNFKLNVDTIFSSESLVLRAQAGFGLGF